MVPKCTQTKPSAAFWVSTMHPSTMLGHGLPWASPWQPYGDQGPYQNTEWAETLNPREEKVSWGSL